MDNDKKEEPTQADKLLIPVERLRWRCDPDNLGFKTTEQIDVYSQIVGQRRAMDALRTGLEIQGTGYNIFVSGPVGTGRTTAVKCLLEDVDKDRKTPDDKCYVNNFQDPDQPTLIRLPAGQANRFQKEMDEFIEYLVKNMPAGVRERSLRTAQEPDRREVQEPRAQGGPGNSSARSAKPASR